MATVPGVACLLPWVQFNVTFEVGEFEFHRIDSYHVENDPDFNVLPQPFDQIVNCTRVHAECPIHSFTAVKKKNTDFGDNLTEDEVRELFDICELLALVCIDRRRIGTHAYVNHGNFVPLCQKIDKIPLTSIATGASRRGGGILTSIQMNYVMETCPKHVSVGRNLEFDKSLLDFLYGFYFSKQDGLEKVMSLIRDFNLANTDWHGIQPSSEFLLLSGAIERVLNSSGNQEDFTRKFSSLMSFVPEEPISSMKKNITNPDSYQNCSTLREYWAADFYRTRNKYAHGNQPRGKLIWNEHEHLCLATFIFPQLLKIYFKNRGLYSLRAFEDNRKLFAFDFLLKRDDLLVSDMAQVMGWHNGLQDAAINSTSDFPIF